MNNNESMWLAECDDYKSFTMHLSDKACFTVKWVLTSPILPDPVELYSVTCPFYPDRVEKQVFSNSLIPRSFRLYCVFWLPLFYPDPVKLNSVSPIYPYPVEL